MAPIRAVPPPPTHNALVVRSLLAVTEKERRKVLEDVEYNVFAFPAGLTTVDFLSDSGTSAMTDVQWAAMLRGDESYGRNWGYYCLLEAFRDTFERGNHAVRVVQDIVMGSADMATYRDKLLVSQEGGFVNGGPFQLIRPNFFLVPQGRCAESILFQTLGQMISEAAAETSPTHVSPAHPIRSKPIIISNGFFDTTGANAAVAGFQLQTFTQAGLNEPFPLELVGKENNFKGNLDVAATEAFLDSTPGVALVLITITNNWAAAQPVSLANIREASALAKRKDIPLFFDACRFAENAWFIQQFEDGYAHKSIQEIVQEMFTHVDGFTISLKKDGMSNMGGALCIRDGSLFARRYDGIGMRLKERQILCYGNDSYGGMSGRDLMAAACGLYEVVKPAYLCNRIGQVQRFATKLQESGVEVLLPPGGHAVYLDMDAFFRYCDRKPGDFVSVGFVLELLAKHGIRSAEAGPFGWEWDKKTPEEQALIPNLVRLAVPRHVMSEEHITYTVAAIADLHAHRHTIPNVEICRGKDMRLRHFSAGLRPITPSITPLTSTYLEEARQKVGHLGNAMRQSLEERAQLQEALSLSMGDWGDKSVSKSTFGWVSEVSNDHAPYEFSIAMDQKTGDSELRFLIEAQPSENSLISLRESALNLAQSISKKYGNSVSLDRFDLIQDLFCPEDYEGLFCAWFSCALSKVGPEWKIYLNPRAKGPEHASSITCTAFERLGLYRSWQLLQDMMDPTDAVIYFSLDLSPASNARVKVYIMHPNTTASAIAQKLARLCPNSSTYETERFCETMAGGSRGPYLGKSLLTCFAFTSDAPESPAGTVHFPVVAYAEDDAEVQSRVENYMKLASVSPIYQDKYQKAISAVQRRPLQSGRGVHAWISLKQEAGGKKINTFYISPELYGPIEFTPQKSAASSSKRDSGVFMVSEA